MASFRSLFEKCSKKLCFERKIKCKIKLNPEHLSIYFRKQYDSYFGTSFASQVPLRILKGQKHHQIKLQRLQKEQTWVFGLLVQQINSL